MNRNKKLERKIKNKAIDERAFSFECWICKEKADDKNDKSQYTYPISELANSEETNENLLICKECYETIKNEKYEFWDELCDQ